MAASPNPVSASDLRVDENSLAWDDEGNLRGIWFEHQRDAKSETKARLLLGMAGAKGRKVDLEDWVALIYLYLLKAIGQTAILRLNH